MKITNLLPGLVLLFAASFSAAAQTVPTTPTNGPTFKGRVLDDATGTPIAGVRILYMFVHDCDGECAGDRGYVTRTDAEGRYEGVYPPQSSGAGHYTIRIEPTNYVWQVINVDKTNTAKMATIPDTRLGRGGWISGQVERPAEADDLAYVSALVKLESQGPLPEHTQLHPIIARDGRFRTPLLPPGSYTLSGDWTGAIRSMDGRFDNWRVLLLNSVSNVNVTVGQETANISLTTNGIVRTNRSYSR
jgi:5-hydroxyisourate hydrolase-like protein (transthyretin family)